MMLLRGLVVVMVLIGQTVLYASTNRLETPPPLNAEELAIQAIKEWGGKVTQGGGGKPITEVDLSNTRVTDSGLKKLQGLKELQILQLSGCAQVSDVGLKELKVLKELRLLIVVGTQVSKAGVADLKKVLPELEIQLTGQERRQGVVLNASMSDRSNRPVTLKIGDMAPPLSVQEFVRGNAVKQFEKGKIYVVEFWTSNNDQSRASIPHMTELQKTHKDVIVIGVSVLEWQPAMLKRFIEKEGEKMGYRVALDLVPKGKNPSEGKMAQDWLAASGHAGCFGIPTAFVINGDGKIAWIGRPKEIDEPLEKIRSGKWDLKAAAAAFDKMKKGPSGGATGGMGGMGGR